MNSVGRQPSEPVEGYHYRPPQARQFTAAEVAAEFHRINRQTTMDRIVEHPIGSIVEFPETGESLGESVIHRFSINPARFKHPKDNIQYSLGDGHGAVSDMLCGKFLNDDSGQPVPCRNLKISCKGLKYCEMATPSPVIRDYLGLVDHDRLQSVSFPVEDVFKKTLAFFCVLQEKGCSFDADTDGDSIFDCHGPDLETDLEEDSELDDAALDCCRSHAKKCQGKLKLSRDQYNRPLIQCEFRKKDSQAHLILRNVDEFNTCYLQALLDNDLPTILLYEHHAFTNGYGPLIQCTFSAAPSAQRQICPYFHRIETMGKLRRGALTRSSRPCKANFSIYTPNNIAECPYIAIVCRNPHSHQDPFPVKTPPALLNIFMMLLKDLSWKLAEATPRKIMLDSGFMQALRRHLGWEQDHDPALSELHPSLGNLDHVRRYIHSMREEFYPHGTGFEGAVQLAKEHEGLPADQKYVRCAEKHTLKDGKIFSLVICMSAEMARRLMASKFLSIDTSFKRVQGGWQEFEMESWDPQNTRSFVGVRAFTTSQSAEAHLILFSRIFYFAELDTGQQVQFEHIHGDGFQLWIADAHKGQALGAGQFCQSLCATTENHCPREPNRRLRDLDPYDHLRRFLRLCVTHFKRKVNDLKPYVSNEVRGAMLSLSSSEPHPNIKGTLDFIEKNGGDKGRAWLKDKCVTNKFALPALYQPYSLIPCEIWKAGPRTSNGNEQAHRNIFRDGIGLSLLGGVMQGLHYDFRAMQGLLLHEEKGIHARDELSTEFQRANRSVTRHINVQHKVLQQEIKGSRQKSQQFPTSSRNSVHEPEFDLPANWDLEPPADSFGPSFPSNVISSSGPSSLYTTRPLNLARLQDQPLDSTKTYPAPASPTASTEHIGFYSDYIHLHIPDPLSSSYPQDDTQNSSESDCSPMVINQTNLMHITQDCSPVVENFDEAGMRSIHEVVPDHFISSYSTLAGALGGYYYP